jgi:hypothetical protein
VVSPPVVIFRRIGVHAEIRTQNTVLSNTRLAKMVPPSHLRRQERILVIEKNTERKSYREIAEITGISKSQAAEIVKG